MKVLISRRAEKDLARIYACLAARNPDAAERFRLEAEKALTSLSRNPDLVPRPGWKTRNTRLRFWVISLWLRSCATMFHGGLDRQSAACWSHQRKWCSVCPKAGVSAMAHKISSPHIFAIAPDNVFERSGDFRVTRENGFRSGRLQREKPLAVRAD
jgi:hypothetical protein